MSEVVYSQEGTFRGREVLIEVREQPSDCEVLVDVSIEQPDGTMGRPVSSEGGNRQLLRMNGLPHIDNAFPDR